MVKSASIVILNYNGEDILPDCLPSIIAASKKSPVPCEVIVLDNQSTDDSVESLRRDFPQVKVEIAKNNAFLFSYNDLIPKIESDVVILLNNDVRVDENFIMPLLKHFDHGDVFAVIPKELPFDGGDASGFYSVGCVSFGAFGVQRRRVADEEGPKFSLYGFNCAFDRKKFVALGGFDDLFYPFTWEDTDLCYGAWKRGWATVYEPKSVIYHKESYSLGREKNIPSRRVISRRNSVLFTWKNITDPKMMANHVFLQVPRLIYSLFNDRAYIAGFFKALVLLPKALSRRAFEKLKARLSDGEVFDAVASGNLDYKKIQVRPRIGIISTWYERGVPYQSKFLAKSLCTDNDVLILAYKERSGDEDPSIYKNLTFMRDVSPGRIIKWIKKERPEIVFSPGRDEDDKVLIWCGKNGVHTVPIVNHETIKASKLEHYKRYSRLLCPVKCTYDLLSKMGLKNIDLVRWAVDSSVYSPALSKIKKPVRFIHNAGLGGAQFRKNTEAVVTAFDLASKTQRNMTLIIKTQKPLREYPDNVRRIAASNPMVTVNEDNLSLGDLVDLYRSCHVSVLPSKWEGIGLPFLESLSLGLPVITVDAPPMNEWIKNGHNGYCCRVGGFEERKESDDIVKGVLVDINDFAQTIIRFSDPNVIEGIRGNCIADARAHEDRFTKEINAFCRSLIGG